MKKILAFCFCLVLFVSISFAVDYSANLSIRTGDAELDLHLKSTNDLASTSTGMVEIHRYLIQNYALSDKEIVFLHKQGYSMAEIEYLALLSRQSKKSINNIILIRNKGVGWGVLAKRIGVHPSSLRKLVVAHKKMEKREKKIEHMEKKHR